MLEFEWDDEKARRNREKHGVSFDEARRVFEDMDRLEAIDDRMDYGEDRIIAIGSDGASVLTVVYVLRAERIRIISARKASREERDEYQASND